MNTCSVRMHYLCALFTVLMLYGCAMPVHKPATASISTPGHLQTQATPAGDIPAPVQQVPVLTPPRPEAPLATYNVVVTDVPVNELLFSLARDARLNVDVHPDVTGKVTINAVNQTLPQILDRIANQVNLRYEIQGPNLVISPDLPFLRNYRVDYVNMSRDNNSNVSVTTQIASTGQAAGETSGGGGGNNSTTSVTSISNHRFWATLEKNIMTIVGESTQTQSTVASSVIINPETGNLTVRATSRQHAQIQSFLDQIMSSARRQVLIEATVVEVGLNDEFQFGVDWSRLASGSAGLSYTQSMLGTNLSSPPFMMLGYANGTSGVGDISATLRMLETFGDVKVLSSPKIMAINNQTAVLKVVDNLVYFVLDVDTVTTDGVVTSTFTSTINTVPVGFVMTVTPQIDQNNSVTLNVRPTISRIIGYAIDPNPELAAVKVENKIPQIQVREMESVLRVQDSQTAVLGGLIQDTIDNTDSGIPGLARLPLIGRLFSYQRHQTKKSELVIFLRPRVIHQPSIDHELSDFQRYLPSASTGDTQAALSARHDQGPTK